MRDRELLSDLDGCSWAETEAGIRAEADLHTRAIATIERLTAALKIPDEVLNWAQNVAAVSASGGSHRTAALWICELAEETPTDDRTGGYWTPSRRQQVDEAIRQATETQP